MQLWLHPLGLAQAANGRTGVGCDRVVEAVSVGKFRQEKVAAQQNGWPSRSQKGNRINEKIAGTSFA
jgi:hypothetical protein